MEKMDNGTKANGDAWPRVMNATNAILLKCRDGCVAQSRVSNTVTVFKPIMPSPIRPNPITPFEKMFK